jgi:hypothetical protein
MFDNPQILIMQHLRTAVPKPEVWFYTRKKFSSMKQADLRDMFTKASNSACTSTVVVPPDPLFPTLINFFSYEDSRKHTRGP